MKTLHEEFYSFRERVWNELESLVHKGSDWYGEFPIVIGEITVPPKGLRNITTTFGDTYEITIKGIIPNPNYYIHPPKKSEKDITVITNKIKVIMFSLDGDKEIEVEPDILDLQTLSTYISGGFGCFK